MLTSVSTLTPRARLNLPHAAKAHALGPAVPSLLYRHRHYQQVRTFGFGWWTGRLDRDEQREARRRFQALQHKHAEALNRRLMWERQSNLGESPRAFRRGGGRYWQSKRCFAFGRHGGRDAFSSADKTAGTRSDQDTEDARRSGWGDFLFRDIQSGKAAPEQSQNPWSSPFDDIRNYVFRRHNEILKDVSFSSSCEHSSRAAEAEGSDYYIDPITNRKVSKVSSRSPPSGNSFKSYRSRFSPTTNATKTDPTVAKKATDSTESSVASQTYDADLPPTAAELRAYQKVNIDDIATTAPVQQSEEYVRQNQPDLSFISDSGDVNYISWKYKGVFWGRQPSDQVEGRSSSSTATSKYNDPAKYAPVSDTVSDSASLAAASRRYDDLAKYKPVKHNEPDGKPPIPETAETAYDPDELAKYQPFKWNEPDGKPPSHSDSMSAYNTAELAKYQPFMWNEPNGQGSAEQGAVGHMTRGTVEIQEHQESELKGQDNQDYSPVEVREYRGIWWNEPDGQPTTAVEQGHHDHGQAELQNYNKPFKYNEPDGKPTVLEGEEKGHSGYDPKEVQQYDQGIRWNEPNGQPTASAELRGDGYDQAEVQQYKDEASDEAYSRILRKISSLGDVDGDGRSPGNGSSSGASGPAAGQSSRSKPEDREKLESAMTRLNAEADIMDKMASVSIKSMKQRSTQHMTKAQRQQALLDPYSKEPQGLETSYSEECRGKPTWPTFVKIHSRTAKADSDAVDKAAAPAPDEGSTVYKILAYDPATQTISVAETASTVHDVATPLTPAKALLQLSHPTKFFPHFRPLEAQGFEIVSGSGDVLVFRKTRGIKQAAASSINPIDKTGVEDVSPSTAARSASPTGCLKPDELQPHQSSAALATAAADPPTPRFRSNIDVRRVEPVFSGAKANVDEAEKSKPGIVKRMVVGATWVAGVSYALGLVGEQLTGTGSSPKK